MIKGKNNCVLQNLPTNMWPTSEVSHDNLPPKSPLWSIIDYVTTSEANHHALWPNNIPLRSNLISNIVYCLFTREQVTNLARRFPGCRGRRRAGFREEPSRAVDRVRRFWRQELEGTLYKKSLWIARSGALHKMPMLFHCLMKKNVLPWQTKRLLVPFVSIQNTWGK